MKKELMKTRIDIKGTVHRLKDRMSTGDTYAVDDAIDFLCGIDNSYSNEIPFLIEALAEAEDEETLNFIICVLKIMNNTLNEKIISILASKIDLIGNKIMSNKIEDNTFALGYIFDYFIEQGEPHKEVIKAVLLKIISSKAPYEIKSAAGKTLKRLDYDSVEAVVVAT
jgi:hypothetical protein